MGNIGAWEIALIVLVILLVFGPKRLPQMGRSLGRGMREFKETVTDQTRELKDATIDAPKEFKEALRKRSRPRLPPPRRFPRPSRRPPSPCPPRWRLPPKRRRSPRATSPRRRLSPYGFSLGGAQPRPEARSGRVYTGSDRTAP
jgi:sec-independent protein translocase protein TatA